MNISLSLLSAYEHPVHHFVAQDKKGGYHTVVNRKIAKEQDIKVVSVAQILKTLASDLSSLRSMTEEQAKKLDRIVKHIVHKNHCPLASPAQIVRNFFAGYEPQSQVHYYRIIINTLSLKINEHRNALPTPSTAESASISEQQVLIKKKSLPTIADTDSLREVEALSSPIQKPSDFRATFEELFSSLPCTFNEETLHRFGITLENLQLLHYFYKSAKVRDDTDLKVIPGNLRAVDYKDARSLLDVTVSHRETLIGALDTLQKQLLEEKKLYSFCMTYKKKSDVIGLVEFVGPERKQYSLEEYRKAPQKAFYLHLRDGHFVLYKLDPKAKQVQFYNSLGKGTPSTEDEAILDMLAKELCWGIVIERGPKQTNATDCGLFCYEKTRRFLLDIRANAFSQKDIPYIRLQATASLLTTSRLLNKQLTKWFKEKLESPASLYYRNTLILPSQVALLKDILEKKREPESITLNELYMLIDKHTIPDSLIPKIEKLIERVYTSLSKPSSLIQRLVQQLPAIKDTKEKIDILTKTLQQLFYIPLEKGENASLCIVVALALTQ